MVEDVVHVFVRPTSPGDRDVYLTSPQAPGLAYGRSTLKEARAELSEVLAFHLDRPGPFQVIEHHERYYELPEGELVTRIAFDEHLDERQDVYSRLGAAVQVPAQARALLSGPKNAAGEVVVVCAVPSDTIGWAAAQLASEGPDALTLAVSVADQMIFTVPILRGAAHGVDVRSGLPAEMTVGEIMRTAPIVRSAGSQPNRDQAFAISV